MAYLVVITTLGKEHHFEAMLPLRVIFLTVLLESGQEQRPIVLLFCFELEVTGIDLEILEVKVTLCHELDKIQSIIDFKGVLREYLASLKLN